MAPNPAPTIAFIGGGNMATSLIGGLIAAGADPRTLRVAEPDRARAAGLAERFGVITADAGSAIVSGADAVVLAVKPQQLREVTLALAPAIKSDALVLSIAAGIPLGHLETWLGAGRAIVRAMPNTPAVIHAGTSAPSMSRFGLHPPSASRPAAAPRPRRSASTGCMGLRTRITIRRRA